MFNPCKHMTMTESEHVYCSPPHLGNVSLILDNETSAICRKCPDYQATYTEEELQAFEQLLETNKKEDE